VKTNSTPINSRSQAGLNSSLKKGFQNKPVIQSSKTDVNFKKTGEFNPINFYGAYIRSKIKDYKQK